MLSYILLSKIYITILIFLLPKDSTITEILLSKTKKQCRTVETII